LLIATATLGLHRTERGAVPNGRELDEIGRGKFKIPTPSHGAFGTDAFPDDGFRALRALITSECGLLETHLVAGG
jgi:hypothetical protein